MYVFVSFVNSSKQYRSTFLLYVVYTCLCVCASYMLCIHVCVCVCFLCVVYTCLCVCMLHRGITSLVAAAGSALSSLSSPKMKWNFLMTRTPLWVVACLDLYIEEEHVCRVCVDSLWTLCNRWPSLSPCIAASVIEQHRYFVSQLWALDQRRYCDGFFSGPFIHLLIRGIFCNCQT